MPTLRKISSVALLAIVFCSARCYYLKQPTDVTGDREFAWLKGKCLELTMPVYLVRYTGVVNTPEERLSLAIPGEMGLYKLPPVSEWPGANGKRVGDTRIVGLLPAGTRLPIERLVEAYPGAGPRIVTLVRVESSESGIASIDELGFRGFPRRKREPFGAAVVACDAPKTSWDSSSETGRNGQGSRTHAECRQLAEDTLNDPKATATRFPRGSSQFPGKTHYQVGNDLLRLDPSGSFRSLYQVK